MQLTFATRPSALARWQTRHVMERLQTAHPALVCREEVIVTRGDRVLDKPLPLIGGKGLFTAELETALRSGRVQAAVHSLKDLPTEMPPGLTLGAIPSRAEPRDVLVSRSGLGLHELPAGAVIGTSSLRRGAQILALRPDLRIRSIRGNVETRLRKLDSGQYEAVVFAAAGLLRLGLEAETEGRRHYFSFAQMLPAPGQGALAVQCRAEDSETLRLLAAIHDPQTAAAVAAERAFLAGLGGGCSVPVGAYAAPKGAGLHLTGLVAAPDGSRLIRVEAEGNHPENLGRLLAEEALRRGAAALLSAS